MKLSDLLYNILSLWKRQKWLQEGINTNIICFDTLVCSDIIYEGQRWKTSNYKRMNLFVKK